MISSIVLYFIQLAIVLSLIPLTSKFVVLLWGSLLAYGYPDIGFTNTYIYAKTENKKNKLKNFAVQFTSLVINSVVVVLLTRGLIWIIMNH